MKLLKFSATLCVFSLFVLLNMKVQRWFIHKAIVDNPPEFKLTTNESGGIVVSLK